MILNDTLTAADGSLLTAHTAESGATYALNPVGSGAVRIHAGRAHSDDAAYAYSSVSAADCEIEGLFHCLSVDGQFAGLLGRMSTASVGWYALLLQLGGGITLYGVSSLGVYPLTFQVGADYRVKLSMHGALLRVFLEGFEILRGTNADRTTGRIGCCFGAATTTTTGLHLASLSASADFSTPQILFDGDSLTQGAGVHLLAHADRYPTKVMELLDSGADWANRGVSGRTLPMMLTNVGQIDICRRPNAPRDVVVIWVGINDLAGGATAQTVIDHLMEYAAGRRTLGFQVVVLSIIAADEAHFAIPPDFDSKRVAVNTWLRANWPTHFDALADVAADARLSDPLDVTYYQTDGLHLEAAGASVVAEIVADAVASLEVVTLALFDPALNDIVLTGNPLAIEWTTTGDFAEVQVFLSIDGGATYAFTLSDGIPNTGSFTWTPGASHLTAAARIRVQADSETVGESALFRIAATSAVAIPGGLTAEELAAALTELKDHGDGVWGRNPILPVLARVNTEPVSRTTLTAYQRARTIHQFFIVDSTGEGVDLSGKSLQFSLETLTGAGVAATNSVAITGEDSNMASVTASADWHARPGLFRYALRDLADGARVWARGDYVVEPTAGPAV